MQTKELDAARIRPLALAFLSTSGIRGMSLGRVGHAASCEAFVGKWAWFVGVTETVNSDGRLSSQPDKPRTVQLVVAISEGGLWWPERGFWD